MCEKRLLPLSCLPFHPLVHMRQLGSHCMDFFETDVWDFFENMFKNLKFYYILTITGTLREDLCTFMTISPWIFLKMRNILDKIVEHTFYIQ
jgi:hypothetical protein